MVLTYTEQSVQIATTTELQQGGWDHSFALDTSAHTPSDFTGTLYDFLSSSRLPEILILVSLRLCKNVMVVKWAAARESPARLRWKTVALEPSRTLRGLLGDRHPRSPASSLQESFSLLLGLPRVPKSKFNQRSEKIQKHRKKSKRK